MNMIRLIVIAVAVFLGIYLVSRCLDKRQPSPNDDAVVSDGAGKVLTIISAVVAVLLFALILPRFGVSFGGFFQTLLNFLPLVRTLLPF
jgi:preprotein translocase subunit SecG